MMASDRTILTLSAGAWRAEVAADGALLLSLSQGGRALLCQDPARAGWGHPALAAGAFPMLPFAGRLRDGRLPLPDGEGLHFAAAHAAEGGHPIHGDGWLRRWDVAEQQPERLVLRLGAEGALYWLYRARLTYSLDPAQGLSLDWALENAADRALPFGFGLHPWFPDPGRVRLEIPAQRLNSVDEEFFPTGAVPVAGTECDFGAGAPLPGFALNNALLEVSGPIRLHWPDLSLEIASTPQMPVAQIFHPPGFRGAEPFVCVEPQSHAPDALTWPDHGRMAWLQPGETLSGRLRLSLLDPKDSS